MSIFLIIKRLKVSFRVDISKIFVHAVIPHDSVGWSWPPLKITIAVYQSQMEEPIILNSQYCYRCVHRDDCGRLDNKLTVKSLNFLLTKVALAENAICDDRCVTNIGSGLQTKQFLLSSLCPVYGLFPCQTTDFL